VAQHITIQVSRWTFRVGTDTHTPLPCVSPFLNPSNLLPHSCPCFFSPEHRPPHPHPPSTTVAHTPASIITTCGQFLLPFSPLGDHHQARGSIKRFDSNPCGFWDSEKMDFSFPTTEAHILGLSLDCRERSGQLR
ncbi:hypothetical protein DVH24_030417, partial [Malus domestica]